MPAIVAVHTHPAYRLHLSVTSTEYSRHTFVVKTSNGQPYDKISWQSRWHVRTRVKNTLAALARELLYKSNLSSAFNIEYPGFWIVIEILSFTTLLLATQIHVLADCSTNDHVMTYTATQSHLFRPTDSRA